MYVQMLCRLWSVANDRSPNVSPLVSCGHWWYLEMSSRLRSVATDRSENVCRRLSYEDHKDGLYTFRLSWRVPASRPDDDDQSFVVRSHR